MKPVAGLLSLALVLLSLTGQSALAHSGENPTTEVPANFPQNKPEVEGQLMTIYPNPFSQSPTISLRLSDRNVVAIKVYDLIGKEHFKADLTNKEGMLRYSPDFSDLQPGIYFCSLYDQDGIILTKKMVKTQ